MNFKKKFKSNNFTRTILMPLLLLKREKANKLAFSYKNVVRGGEIILYVRNLQSEYYLDARSHLALRVIQTGEYETEMFPIIKNIWSGGSIINIGANVGFWAIGLSKLLDDVNRIVAIEPHPSAFEALVKNIHHNHVEDIVKPIQALISSGTKNVEFEFIPGLPEYSSIGGIVHPSALNFERKTISIQSQSLDTIEEIKDGINDFNLMIVDVEGAEFLVFEGSKEFLQSNRPSVLFECSDEMLEKFGNSVEQIIDFWDSLNYKMINAETMKVATVNEFHYGEALAIPVENTELLNKILKS
jgi:FkbM family methyltransferase